LGGIIEEAGLAVIGGGGGEKYRGENTHRKKRGDPQGPYSDDAQGKKGQCQGGWKMHLGRGLWVDKVRPALTKAEENHRKKEQRSKGGERKKWPVVNSGRKDWEQLLLLGEESGGYIEKGLFSNQKKRKNKEGCDINEDPVTAIEKGRLPIIKSGKGHYRRKTKPRSLRQVTDGNFGQKKRRPGRRGRV